MRSSYYIELVTYIRLFKGWINGGTDDGRKRMIFPFPMKLIHLKKYLRGPVFNVFAE